jgi:hypothetical protein
VGLRQRVEHAADALPGLPHRRCGRRDLARGHAARAPGDEGARARELPLGELLGSGRAKCGRRTPCSPARRRSSSSDRKR